MEKPIIVQKHSLKLEMETGTYMWCSCGRSEKQPFCDGSHRGTHFKPEKVVITIWMVFISLIDNVIKPMVMGQKAPAPTLVIFLGAIGGFMLNGIIGLFIGAVIFSLGYNIFHWWLHMNDVTE